MCDDNKIAEVLWLYSFMSLVHHIFTPFGALETQCVGVRLATDGKNLTHCDSYA